MLDFQTYVDSKPASLRRVYKLKTGYRDSLVRQLSVQFPIIMQVELWGWQPDFVMSQLTDMGITEIKNWTPTGPGKIKIPVSRYAADYPKNQEPSIRWLVRTDNRDEMGRFALGDDAQQGGNAFSSPNTIHYTDQWGFEAKETSNDVMKWMFRGDFSTGMYWFEEMSLVS